MGINDLDWREPANDNQRKCAVCDTPITGQPTKVYCGDACSSKASAARRLEKSPVRQCDRCGASFKAIKKDKLPPRFCSKTCSGKAMIIEVKATNHLAAPKPVKHTIYRQICIHCSVRFTSAGPRHKICSAECRILYDRARAVEYQKNKPSIDRSARICPECAVTFAPEYGRAASRYCTSECAKRHNTRIGKKRRRAKLRGVANDNVNPFVVFERDKWKCQLCGVKTPRKLRGTHKPNAPELDHIMPLSLGGAHSYMNTQCACRACNSAKSNTPPAQPSLFAYAA